MGTPVCNTGMTWVGFRPSDDQCDMHFHVPGNMFAVVALGFIETIANDVYHDAELAQAASRLATEIDDAIHQHAVVERAGVRIYAYEVNGCGQHNLMDDANVPSLLSIPYLGYKSRHDPEGTIYKNTRNYILSSNNPWYFSHGSFRGIGTAARERESEAAVLAAAGRLTRRASHVARTGSPHTGPGRVWPMSLIMQALTSDSESEIVDMIEMLKASDAGSNFMHESFQVSNPAQFTRHWFAWANSLFSELIIKHKDLIKARKLL